MEPIICDMSALRYWRIPPVVQLLASAPEADTRLTRVLTSNDLELLAANAAQTQAKFAKKHCGHTNEAYRTIAEASHVLGLNNSEPFDLLCRSKGAIRESQLIAPRLWSAELPLGAIREISPEINVASPEFTMQQLAARATFVQALLLATELCGSFAIFQAPSAIAKVIQRLCAENKLPTIDGWAPCLAPNGQLTSLWNRPPLTTKESLMQFAQTSPSSRGRAKLSQVAKFVVNGAASPFEAQAGILLNLPRRNGGIGLVGLEHNHRVGLTPDAAALAGRGACYCDLYWDEGVDLECHSGTWHAAVDNQLSDFTRQTALELMGIDVIPMTYEQMVSQRQFNAVARLVADKLDRKLRAKSSDELETEAELRRQVLNFDWETPL